MLNSRVKPQHKKANPAAKAKKQRFMPRPGRQMLALAEGSGFFFLGAVVVVFAVIFGYIAMF